MNYTNKNAMIDIKSSDFYIDALLLAARFHKGQRRKYTEVQYISHPIAVADIIIKLFWSEIFSYRKVPAVTMVQAALLHDVLEDTDCTEKEIIDTCGETVLNFVKGLTEPDIKGNRRKRKTAYLQHLSEQGPCVQTIKCADLYDNTKSIARYDPKFSKVYLKEKKSC